MTAAVCEVDASPESVTFVPGILSEDALAQYWLGQATLRLRREVCWLWRERSMQTDSAVFASALPPAVDRALAALDLVRYEREKRTFFAQDATAQHLSARIAAGPVDGAAPVRGSFGWVIQHLHLKPVECFVLALGLLPSVDSAAGPVFASCLNEPSRTSPTLALAQRLWDEPDEVLGFFDLAHPLLRYGLLTYVTGAGANDWNSPLIVPHLVARELLFPGGALPAALIAIAPALSFGGLDPAVVARVNVALTDTSSRDDDSGSRIVPILGSPESPLAEIAAAYAKPTGVTVLRPSLSLLREQLAQALTAAWLRGSAVYLPASLLADVPGHDANPQRPQPYALPLALFVGVHERAALRGLGSVPAIEVPVLSYAARLECWRAALPARELEAELPELARRFRYDAAAVARVGTELNALGRTPTRRELFAAARADVDLGSLAQRVQLRFACRELMLPNAQGEQIAEIIVAMRNLTRVHYEWGTARSWSDGGLSALFAGPPGTGKTMAAEAIASELELPLYRIDLSQVVNKYIGETEKNLRRLFDAAEAADLILFFDEADALFGKRTEVRDAHDRYANLEISYLLERMERFKGLAVLASNRKRDLDEAFLRRLRFVVDFPMPAQAERLRIWRSMVPENIDTSAIDFEFLAQRFALAGGHIRAIVFQACLQSADEGAPHRLGMAAVVRAIQREYDKLNRTHSVEQFGPYAGLVTRDPVKPRSLR